MLPPIALLDPMVGECCEYVQGESLKAWAALLVRLLNSPVTRAEEFHGRRKLGKDRVLLFGVIAWATYAFKKRPWNANIGAFALWMLLLPIWILAEKLVFD